MNKNNPIVNDQEAMVIDELGTLKIDDELKKNKKKILLKFYSYTIMILLSLLVSVHLFISFWETLESILPTAIYTLLYNFFGFLLVIKAILIINDERKYLLNYLKHFNKKRDGLL